MRAILLLALLTLLAGCMDATPAETTDVPNSDGWSTFHLSIEGHDCLFIQNFHTAGSSYSMTKVQCDGKW